MNVIAKINGKDGVFPVRDLMANKQRLITIDEPISTPLASEFVLTMKALALKSKDRITILINSPGGSVSDGNAMIDAITECQENGIEVATVATGLVASMASILLASGTRGSRYITSRAKVLIHQPIIGFSGQVTDAEIAYTLGKQAKNDLIDYLAETTTTSAKQIAKDIERDYIMGAKEALKYGIVDKIGYPEDL
ncbi:MAG: ATP-dependent Clp protease proteolytic subunit [Saccharofermentans sp.]|nr:ATP-dependent Clp protease proteolytic subunit [Saccharofermentans sp.]